MLLRCARGDLPRRATGHTGLLVFFFFARLKKRTDSLCTTSLDFVSFQGWWAESELGVQMELNIEFRTGR